MENPQDKKGHNTTYTCPHTAKRIYRFSLVRAMETRINVTSGHIGVKL